MCDSGVDGSLTARSVLRPIGSFAGMGSMGAAGDGAGDASLICQLFVRLPGDGDQEQTFSRASDIETHQEYADSRACFFRIAFSLLLCFSESGEDGL